VQGFHINANGLLFGGTLLAWVDEDCTMCTSLTCKPGTRFTTAGYERINFYKPCIRGDKLCFTYKIIHVGTSSMTLLAKVLRHGSGERVFSCVATLVSVDDHGSPMPVEPMLSSDEVKKLIKVRTAEEQAAWEFVEYLRKERKSKKEPEL
jgi:acyl-CoA hydrolase